MIDVICIGSDVPWFEAGETYKAEKIMNSDRLSIYDREGDEFSDWVAVKVINNYLIAACDAWFKEVK